MGGILSVNGTRDDLEVVRDGRCGGRIVLVRTKTERLWHPGTLPVQIEQRSLCDSKTVWGGLSFPRVSFCALLHDHQDPTGKVKHNKKEKGKGKKSASENKTPQNGVSPHTQHGLDSPSHPSAPPSPQSAPRSGTPDRSTHAPSAHGGAR